MIELAQVIDLDERRLVQQVREVHRLMRDAERDELTAREFAAARRLELGTLLTAARKRWPARGPNAKGWGAFLADAAVDQDVALDAMKYAGYVEKEFPGPRPGKLPTMREAGVRRDSLTDKRDVDAPKADRGAWCTPEPIAIAVGSDWDVDPFSNPRSHIKAHRCCMLENGDDGFGAGGKPGSYRYGGEIYRADKSIRLWGQPDYSFVLKAVQHYKHTRFCFLLRLDPSTEWFDLLYGATSLILVPKGDRIEFDPPPDVEASSNPYPHGLFYAHAKDATKEIRALCYEWRVS